MIIDNINKLPIREKIVIALCFPCLLKKLWGDGLLSVSSIIFLTLIYLSFLIQNIYYEIYEIYDSKNIVLVLFLSINLFTYVLIEAIKTDSRKAKIEAILILIVLLLLANFHYLSAIFVCLTMGERCQYSFNQNFEIVLIVSSFSFLIFVVRKLFFSHSTNIGASAP